MPLNGLPSATAMPRYTTNEDIAINGKNDGTSILRQNSSPFKIPSEQFSEYISNPAHKDVTAVIFKIVVNFFSIVVEIIYNHR